VSRFERDTIKRQIKQLGDAVAALVLRAKAEADYDTGLEAVRNRAQDGLGIDYALLGRLAPDSAAMLLRDGEVVGTYAWITAEEASLEQAAGRTDEAARLRCRAAELYVEAAQLDRSGEAECRAAIAELDVRAEDLGPRYRAWLDRAEGGSAGA